MNTLIHRCRERLDLISLGVGSVLAVAFLSLTIVGAFIGVLLLLMGLPLLVNPRRRVC